jgi:hypothetical protein
VATLFHVSAVSQRSECQQLDCHAQVWNRHGLRDGKGHTRCHFLKPFPSFSSSNGCGYLRNRKLSVLMTTSTPSYCLIPWAPKGKMFVLPRIKKWRCILEMKVYFYPFPWIKNSHIREHSTSWRLIDSFWLRSMYCRKEHRFSLKTEWASELVLNW